jgi:hypothetical protein
MGRRNQIISCYGLHVFFFLFFFEVEVLINKKLKDPESPDPRTARP